MSQTSETKILHLDAMQRSYNQRKGRPSLEQKLLETVPDVHPHSDDTEKEKMKGAWQTFKRQVLENAIAINI